MCLLVHFQLTDNLSPLLLTLFSTNELGMLQATAFALTRTDGNFLVRLHHPPQTRSPHWPPGFPSAPAPAAGNRSRRPRQGRPTDSTPLLCLGASSSAFLCPAVPSRGGYWPPESFSVFPGGPLPYPRLAVSDTVFHQESETFLLLYKYSTFSWISMTETFLDCI